ncbi:hypothetical protein IGI68_001423 [Enterococcus sp. DIV1314a]
MSITKKLSLADLTLPKSLHVQRDGRGILGKASTSHFILQKDYLTYY